MQLYALSKVYIQLALYYGQAVCLLVRRHRLLLPGVLCLNRMPIETSCPFSGLFYSRLFGYYEGASNDQCTLFRTQA